MPARRTAFRKPSIALFVVLCFVPCMFAQSTERVIYAFPLETSPNGGLVLDHAGNLYGVTLRGGTNDLGTVYKLKPKASGYWDLEILHSFQESDGSFPVGKLIFDSQGNLFGVTEQGGAAGFGTAFELTPGANGTWSETVLHSFQDSPDGYHPEAGLIFDQVGNLYGVTYRGGENGFGAVFELSPQADGTWQETVLYSFTSGNDGANPLASLTIDIQGNLYGTTISGGNETCLGACGTVFELMHLPSGERKEVILHAFKGSDGAWPSGKLLLQGATFYGTTAFGGNGLCYDVGVNRIGCGTVFALQLGSDGNPKFIAIGSFQDFTGNLGSSPTAGLISDGTGQLYGVTVDGGEWHNCSDYGEGVAYRLSHPNQHWSETVLHQFNVRCQHDADNPIGELVLDSQGNLYGASTGGGQFNGGAVFEIVP
jgi:uncharacterized repeat protein (TIGR03803 family)